MEKTKYYYLIKAEYYDCGYRIGVESAFERDYELKTEQDWVNDQEYQEVKYQLEHIIKKVRGYTNIDCEITHKLLFTHTRRDW